ncbi:MAG: 50S ribosomal protein L24 [Planctomycetales bacterium]|nr:50S ribosomal protein L24 [Planctomycetales bacterium]
MRIKLNDTVKVIAGADRGVQGRVISVDHDSRKVIVEGVNRVYKHVRRSQRNPQGGRLNKEMPIPVSNVLLVCEKCGKASRIGAKYLADGSKVRYCKKCGANIDTISPPRTAYAKN